MSKTVYFVRHGESMYNKWRRESFRNPCVLCCVCDPMLFDAALSPAGEAQVRNLHDQVRAAEDPWLSRVELVVTSPLTRAVETCLGAFFPESSYVMSPGRWSGTNADFDAADGATSARVPAQHPYGAAPLCCALPREAMDTSCDVGTPVAELRERYNTRVDTMALEESVWWYDSKTLRTRAAGEPHLIVRESKSDVRLRIRAFRKWLANRPEKVIAVVGHSAYIKQFTGMSRKLKNCEVLKYTLALEES
jgi:broad specificity phosphatase PhoE